MPHRKKTLRRLPPTARKIAKLCDDLHSVEARLKHLLPAIVDLEMWERAERRSSAAAPSAEGLKLERTPELADFTEEEGA